MTKQEFLERARKTHGYKYIYPNLGNKILSYDDIEIIYNGISYTQKVVKHILLGRCPEKNTAKKTTEQFIKEAKEVWNDKYDYSLTEYKGALKKVKIIFNGIVFEQTAIDHLNKSNCEYTLSLDVFISKAIKKWGDKYDYSLITNVICSKKVDIIYKKTNEVFKQYPHRHLTTAPEKVRKKIKWTTEQFILESNIIHDNKFDYSKTDYKGIGNKVIIICPIHGDFNQTPGSHLRGRGCGLCNDSKGEKAISKYLDKNLISYYRQHKFEDCKNIHQLPFDFYIPSKRLIIEFDGKQHYEPMSFFGGVEAYERLKVNDNIKNEYCEDNYIDLVRIKYDSIDNIISILDGIFKKTTC
jgi:very-short-patch-repair endonuclease